jgi:hypothetical protein
MIHTSTIAWPHCVPGMLFGSPVFHVWIAS